MTFDHETFLLSTCKITELILFNELALLLRKSILLNTYMYSMSVWKVGIHSVTYVNTDLVEIMRIL